MAKPKPVDFDHLSKLSNLPTSPDEASRLTDQFNETIQAIDKLSSVPTHDVPATHHTTGLTNVFRPDKIDPDRILTQKQALSNSTNTHQGYFVVSALIDHEA